MLKTMLVNAKWELVFSSDENKCSVFNNGDLYQTTEITDQGYPLTVVQGNNFAPQYIHDLVIKLIGD